jgi:small subunit ribosomal protein S20
MRGNERKHLHNRAIKSVLRRQEKSFRDLVAAGKKDEAVKSLPAIHSVCDKAAKSGVIPRSTADRKKSRLAMALGRLK